MEAKIAFCTSIGPKKGSKYHLETVQILFSENNNNYRTMFVKLNFFHAWKCIISGVKYQSKFWHLRRNQLSYIQYGYFFKILWWCHKPYDLMALSALARWVSDPIQTYQNVLSSAPKQLQLGQLSCCAQQRPKLRENPYHFTLTLGTLRSRLY